MRRVRPIALAIATTMVLFAIPAAGASPHDEVIVVLNPTSDDVADVARGLAEKSDGQVGFLYEHALQGFTMRLPSRAVAGLSRNPQVAYIEPIQEVAVANQPIPTGVDRVEGDLNQPTMSFGGSSYDTSPVVVAVLDTGVYIGSNADGSPRSHLDLNLRRITDCTSAILYPLFGGCTGSNYTDQHGHGTHVAGIIGAKDNEFGSLGTAPGATIWSIKVLQADGTGTTGMILAGIDLVASQPTIDVANMSLGFQGTSQAINDAISNSVDSGHVFVVAAGNDGIDASNFSPANIPDPEVVTVSALADYDGKPGGVGDYTCRADQVDDKLATFSNFGPMVEIAAPGVCIYSTHLNDGYATFSGTSMAAPAVAGAIARYIGENGLDPQSRSDVRAIVGAVLGNALPQDHATCGFDDVDNSPEPLLYLNGDAFGGSNTCEDAAGQTNGRPTAADDGAAATEDGSTNIDVLGNDSDPDGDTLIVSGITTAPANGTATIEANDTITYIPDSNYNGADSFTYEACDPGGLCDTAIVSVTVAAVNDAPVAGDDGAATSEGTPVVIDVLANDNDVDADGLSVTNLAQPGNGSAVVEADNSITYTPNGGFDGTDTFTYTAYDGTTISNLATVTVNVNPVNDPPTAIGDTGTTPEDTAVTIDVLTNDSDPDGDVLTVTDATQGANGSVVVNSDDTITYIPDSNYNGADSFTYEACDPGGLCDTAIVSVTVAAVNDAPVAGDDGAATSEGTPVVIDVLANDNDVDADTLSVDSVTQGTNGTVTTDGNTITYTPNGGFDGTDTFTYTVCDTALCDTATVIVTVEPTPPPPSAGPDLQAGVITTAADWTSVGLEADYGSDMVVIATPNYDESSVPLVARIRNATGNGFDVMLVAADGSDTPVSGEVHWLVARAGVYTEAEHGVKMEVAKYDSTITSRRGSWNGEAQSYAQAYSSPVVLGQVMTANDGDWSLFWADGGSRSNPPTASTLRVGKHVAEHSDTVRVTETVGYIVFEQSSGTVDGVAFTVGLGGDSVRGVGNSPGYTYSIGGPGSATGAVLSSAGMDGNDGGWPILYGVAPVTSTGIRIAIDEDQVRDSDRRHTTEQVAYFVFASPTAD